MPQIAPRIETARRLRRFDRWICRLPFVSVTYLAKLSVPPFGAMGLALGIPMIFAVAALGVMAGRMVLDVRRTLAFFLMLGVLFGIQLLYIDTFSLPSMVLFFVVHAPYIVRMARPELNADRLVRYFQSLVLFIGVCGMVQYVAQFVIGPTLAYPIENFTPEPLLLGGFNMQGVLQYGSEVRRTNGIFMIEPSMFSQLLAIGIMVEIGTRKRWWYLALQAAAILVSYSGTGLMLLAFCLMFEAIVMRRWEILIGTLAVGALALTVASVQEGGILHQILGRAGEFDAAGSSGSARFLGGFYLFDQFLWTDPMRALFGFGAGTFAEYSMRSPVPAAEMILFKTIFEFGAVGAIAYWGFIGYCIFTAKSLPFARMPVTIAILLGALYTPFAHCLAFGLLLWPARASGNPISYSFKNER